MLIQEHSLSYYHQPPLVTEELEFMNSGFDDLSMDEEGNSSGRMHTSNDEAEGGGFKSKNLEAERRRRKKLNARLLELRSLVPIITNMNKGTILIDAITYIEDLQKCVRDLSNQLLEIEAACAEESISKSPTEATDATEEMRKWGIEPEVKVTQLDAKNLWIKIVYQKKRGGFAKLMEAMSVLGYEFTDTSVTTSKGATLVTAYLLGTNAGILEADQIRELLLEIAISM